LWRSFLFGVPYPVWDKAGDRFTFPVFANGEGGARDPSAVVDQEEFVIVNRDGNVARTGPVASVETSIQSYGLSPDGRYIWFDVPDGPLDPGLYLWDTKSSALIDCFKNAAYAPIWSPDGQQFIIQPISETGVASPLFVVDLQSNTYFELSPTKAFVVAWLASAN
jgi:hypothetical protein